MVSWHLMGISFRFEGEKKGKQATLNSSNYMRIILYRTQVAYEVSYEAHLLGEMCTEIMYHALAKRQHLSVDSVLVAFLL